MPLTTGTRLGVYEVTGALGAGGMGEVYRARDTQLNRDVAIKVLPELFALDAERLARFTREAQTLAALNHPNIAQIYGLVEGALVMELVDGDDLSVLIARGPVPLAEALPLAKQIADALEAAHEQGIIHRDLKPANIKVRPDGTVKILDFGLAKAMAPEGSGSGDAMHSPTLTARATQMGMIIGTAAYMAPEQAKGKAVDRRADIWAFGVVLYEMLTGGRAFKGDDITEVLATVLKTEPDWQALGPGTPSSIRRLLRRCLEKEPRRRLSAISDARLELDEIEPDVAATASALPAARRIGLPIAAGLAVLLILATAGVMRYLPASSPVASGPVAPTRLSITLPDGDEVTDTNLLPVAISVDGTNVAYVATRDGVRRLFLRSLASAEPVMLAGTEGAHSPFFSPDGLWIGFFAQGKLKKAAVGSSAVQVIAEDAPHPRGGAWSADGTIYYAPSPTSALWKVAAAGGGASTAVTRLDPARGEVSHRWPQVLPDGVLLFSSWTGPGPDERMIVARKLATGQQHVLLSTGDTPRYLSPGYLAYGRLDTLLAVPWQPSQTALREIAPISLPEFPRIENEGAVDYGISETGTLAYVAGGIARYAQRVVWVDRTGRIEQLPMPERDYEAVTLSPDRQRAVVQIREGAMGLWLYDFARHTLTPLATTGGSSQAPVWTADGLRVIYRGTRQGTRNLYWKLADGSGQEERLTTKMDVNQAAGSVSPDGQWLVFNESPTEGRAASLWMMHLEGDRVPRRIDEGMQNGQVSTDGRWLAYQADVAGQSEVYVTPFPGPGPRTPVSANGGDNPLWSHDGNELFYTSGDKTMTVTVNRGATISVGTPRVLYEGRFRPGSNSVTPFGVSSDGRFLRIQQVQPDRPVTRIEVVLNWFSALPALSGVK
jgi:serine/threonine-protein kinase